MSAAVSTIDAYIAACPEAHRELLSALREIILEAAPRETTETISYKMPTFRYHGNLIHFALHKAHLGIYPGAAALEALKAKISGYKTTKGAILLPLDQPLPRQLIKDLVMYNAALLKDRKGPTWHESRGNWQEAEELMQRLMLKAGLQKMFKWGSDIYTYDNKNVIGWAGFKNFFSLWFYNGVFLEDKDKVLVAASEGKTRALRQWRFTDVKDMDEQKILAYILESIRTIKDGKSITLQKAPHKSPSGLLKEYLDADEALKTAFNKLTPGKQRAYMEYIDEARQEQTKLARLEKIRPLILDGQGLHDKYKR